MKGCKISLCLLVIISTLTYGIRVRNPCTGFRKLPCDNGQCINRLWWCDGTMDCQDESDEKYCKTGSFGNVPNNNCTEKHFVCDDGKCIPISLRCDGERDCSGIDRYEEENCDQDDTFYTSERQPDYIPSTISSVSRRSIPTQPPTPDYHVGRRTDEPYDYSRRYDHYTTPPSNVYDSYDPYNPRYPDQGNDRRGSDTHPGRSFPDNQQPDISPYPPETTSQRRTYRPNRQDPPRSDYPYVERESLMIFPPRSIFYPPRRTSPNPIRRMTRRPNFSHFYFSKNYTKDFEYEYETSIREAKAWLEAQRDESFTWGRDTPRGLIALSLLSNSFNSDVENSELMQKALQTHLGIRILRNDSGIEKISTTRLAMYINALLATCQNPYDFLGLDLVDILYRSQHHLEQYQKFINPLIYLSLCLVDKPIPVEYLEGFLLNSFPTEISKDLHILATTAMACVVQQNPRNTRISRKLDDAARSLLNQMNRTDGSFGSKYSTALAAQVLMSVNTSIRWDAQKTLDYLVRQQREDGSFGDMQSTYYTLIALSGRSLLHLRNTRCDPVDIKREWSPEDILNAVGPRKTILYTLRIDYPEKFSAGMQMSVPVDTNFFDIMRVAAHQDPRFKFNHKITKGELGVHTIANIPSDPERGVFWNLYWLHSSDNTIDLRNRYTEDITNLIPQHGDELLYWYLSAP